MVFPLLVSIGVSMSSKLTAGFVGNCAEHFDLVGEPPAEPGKHQATRWRKKSDALTS